MRLALSTNVPTESFAEPASRKVTVVTLCEEVAVKLNSCEVHETFPPPTSGPTVPKTTPF